MSGPAHPQPPGGPQTATASGPDAGGQITARAAPAAAPARPRLVVIAPLAPAATGNGLAMRIDMLVGAAAIDHDVRVCVVPVAGSLRPGSRGAIPPSAISTVPPVPPVQGQRRESWAVTPAWERRWEALQPLAPAVAAAPVTLAPAVVGRLGADPVTVAGVLACRLTVAPLALRVAELLGVPLVVDADDDDVALSGALGNLAEAAASARVGRLCLPAAEVVLAASDPVGAALEARFGLAGRVRTVPNAVTMPDRLPGPLPGGTSRLLFVGNLTYPPNVKGACWLVEEVLPLLDPTWIVELVGQPAPEVAALAGPRVRVTGPVERLDDRYAGATVVAVPLLAGSGTRIKVLEAFAHRRPVVATPIGADGLLALDGVHLRLAATPEAFAAAVSDLSRPDVARPLVDAAADLVAATYDAHAVRHRAARLLAEVLAVPPTPPEKATMPDAMLRPRSAGSLEVNEVDDGLIIYDPRRDRVHHLNNTAAVVFTFCTGDSTESEIAEQVGDLFGLGRPATEETGTCLAHLRSEGLIV